MLTDETLEKTESSVIKKISIPYFPSGMKLTTPLFFGGGIYFAVAGLPFWGVAVLVAGILILTTRYVTEINLQDKTYRDYLSFLWMPFNVEAKRFNSLDRIIITKGNYSQTINTRIQSRQLDWSDFTGTLLSDNGTLDLLTRNDKKELIKGLKEFAHFLKVGVEDQTTGVHYWIDLDKY